MSGRVRDKPCSPTAAQSLCCKRAVSEIGNSNSCPYITARLKLSTPQPKCKMWTGRSTRPGQQPAHPQNVSSPPPGTHSLHNYNSWDQKAQAGRVKSPCRLLRASLSADRASERHGRDRQTILSHLTRAGRERCSHPQGEIPCLFRAVFPRGSCKPRINGTERLEVTPTRVPSAELPSPPRTPSAKHRGAVPA